MKRQSLTLILLLAVTSIWGVLIYKIYHTLHNDKRNTLAAPFSAPANTSKIPGEFILHEYPRDPFLSILADTVTSCPVVNVTVIKKVVDKKITLPLYFGLIQNRDKRTAILKMEQKIFFVHEGEIFRSIRISRIVPDSVIAFYEGKKYTLLLKRKS